MFGQISPKKTILWIVRDPIENPRLPDVPLARSGEVKGKHKAKGLV
jgi:hypothetical protein